MPPPKKKEFFNATRVDIAKTATAAGNSPDGSFWKTPLNDDTHFWTVKGPSKTGGKF